MDISTSPSQITIADQLLKQLEDEYLAIHAQNITMPKQNLQPQDDPENPYQSIDLDDDSFNEEQNYNNQQEHTNQQGEEKQQQQKPEQSSEDFKKQVQNFRLPESQSNTEVKELMQVLPVDESIYISLPHKDFDIDEQKIKAFALSMQIDQPQWLLNQDLCKVRIEQLFIKKAKIKPFTKI